MRWLMTGAGALGGYFGGRLIQAGQDVSFLVRPRRLTQLRATGLAIRSPHGDADIAGPRCVQAQATGGPYDIVMVSCKAYDLDSVMDAIAPAVGPDTTLYPVLNGISHLDRLVARFGDARVLGGLAMISAALDAQGVVQHLNDQHFLAYGERDGSHSDRVRAIEAAFAPANFDSRPSDAILQEMWEKWILIAAVAGATCLMRAAIGDLVQVGAADVTTGLLEECAAIATANGFAPRPKALERMRAFVTRAESTMTASMLKDVERGARTEGEHIFGELLARVPSGTPVPPLLRLADVHLRAYEVRRMREQAQPA